MSTTEVVVKDKYGDKCLKDSMCPVSGCRKPEGYVEIYEVDKKTGKRKLVGKQNLVVYIGREYVASRIVNQENDNITPDEDEFLGWFGVGTGGAPLGDPLNPNAPISTDTSLSTEVSIHDTDTDCGDFRSGAYYKHPFDSIEFEQDTDNNSQWLIVKITMTLGDDDANGNNLNEAAIYTADSNAGEHTGPFNMFSLITYPTLVKDATRQIIFIWYLYF